MTVTLGPEVCEPDDWIDAPALKPRPNWSISCLTLLCFAFHTHLAMTESSTELLMLRPLLRPPPTHD